MNYLKSLILCFIGIAIMFTFWVFSLGVGPFYGLRPFHGYGAHLIFSLSLSLAAFLLYIFIEKKYEDWIILPIGWCFGAGAGTFCSLMLWCSDIVANSHGGFWLGLLYAFIGVVIVGAGSVCFGAALKNFFLGIIRLDFVVVLVSFIVGVSVFYAGMSFLVACFQYHVAAGIFVIIGLTGNAAVFSAPVVNSGGISDANGNIHYVVGTNADGSVTTTSGERMRKMSDNTYKEF